MPADGRTLTEPDKSFSEVPILNNFGQNSKTKPSMDDDLLGLTLFHHMNTFNTVNFVFIIMLLAITNYDKMMIANFGATCKLHSFKRG
jgi:hypothetical protein